MPVDARHKAQFTAYHCLTEEQSWLNLFCSQGPKWAPLYSLPWMCLCVCVKAKKILYRVEEPESVKKSTNLLPRVSYCLIFLMKWTFLDALGPGEPGRFCVLWGWQIRSKRHKHHTRSHPKVPCQGAYVPSDLTHGKIWFDTIWYRPRSLMFT